MAEEAVNNFNSRFKVQGSKIVLDLATGTADSAIAILKKRVKVVGVDISYEMLKAGNKKIKNKFENCLFFILSLLLVINCLLRITVLMQLLVLLE